MSHCLPPGFPRERFSSQHCRELNRLRTERLLQSKSRILTHRRYDRTNIEAHPAMQRRQDAGPPQQGVEPAETRVANQRTDASDELLSAPRSRQVAFIRATRDGFGDLVGIHSQETI